MGGTSVNGLSIIRFNLFVRLLLAVFSIYPSIVIVYHYYKWLILSLLSTWGLKALKTKIIDFGDFLFIPRYVYGGRVKSLNVKSILNERTF